MHVEFPQEIISGSARLSLWQAEATGAVESKGGKAIWSTVVHSDEPVIRYELAATGDLAATRFVYIAEEARNPRAVRAKIERQPVNPPAVHKRFEDGVQTSVHNLFAGGQTAVAWYQSVAEGRTRVWLSVIHSYPGLDAEEIAANAVRKAASANQAEWIDQHRQWWHDYYQTSFLSTGDPYWDAFYWIQQYKLASATRAEKWIIDNQGPWLQPTAWNALWWNLNVPLSHSGFATANRRGMGSAIGRRLDLCRDQLAMNVAEEYRHDAYAIGRSSSGWDLAGHAGQPGTGRPPMDAKIGHECGNLLWALHNVDLGYRDWQIRICATECSIPCWFGR
ncbi:hypothetical protein Q31b_06150 [Novipirellula aureliae]|uniref:Uncharacterized protein n=1 Tax=Novipirellula aureliae TaxID=2527966 RepID=A0A5C6E716_9BACT|nr:hypothetical protein [Novipirellula aureliae]TWU45443.1 hypothetical protein Q31b_06150 [Novipirellula aureliae]